MTAPMHTERPPMRRPRLWHSLALGTACLWALSTMVNPSDCEAKYGAPPAAAVTVEPDTTIKSSDYRTGKSSNDLTWCQALHGTSGEGLIRCGVSDGVLKQSALDRIESAQEKNQAAKDAAAAAEQKADAKLAACRGSRGGWTDSLHWLLMGLGIATLVTGWRRAKVYGKHKKDCALTADFARKYPPQHIELAPNELLEQVIPAAFAAAGEAFGQRTHWFGGNADEDTDRAYVMQDIAQAANQERKRRLGGGWVHGAPSGDIDLPAPVLPQTDAQPTGRAAPGADNWRSNLANSNEDW